ncbi:uncharacterized protein LOC125579009 [Brassica napus]|uniref:uncharacterized protein LOC125579009 n=1 Tax=Brassica napus TaxID=3708 RepID=UPI0020791328|nr:uncharacterized protein LOC125579009 [Brassica napus]
MQFTVDGFEEYLNRSDSNVLQSPTSVAKLPPNTAVRTTRRKTSVKAEPQPSSSQLVNRSCRLASKKSLDGEMDQENVAQEAKTNNVKFEANVAKTPAAQSTRKDPGETSCSSKVLESKKGELVQSAYNTRRSARLLEKCMADLSLKITETLGKHEKIEETEQKNQSQFPRPDKSASKKSAMKVDNVGTTNKENSMEMNIVNDSDNGESNDETKKKKKVETDEENLGDVSMRQLVKMVKELSIKSSNNRAALLILPGNNQIAE